MIRARRVHPAPCRPLHAALAAAARRRRGRRAAATGPQRRPGLPRPQAAVHAGAPLLDSMCRDRWRLQLRQARADRRPARPLRAGHLRARQDRLPGRARCCAPARTWSSPRASRSTPRRATRSFDYAAAFRDRLQVHGIDLQAHAERRAARALARRTTAAARLHPQQCLPDRAPPGRLLPPPARARGGRRRGSAGGAAFTTGGAGAFATACPARRRPTAPRWWRADRLRGFPEGRCTARRCRSAVTSTRTTSRAGAVPHRPLRRGPAAGDLRATNSWRLRLHEVETPELLEVQLVNAIAPYILNAAPSPLLMKSAAAATCTSSTSAQWKASSTRTTKTDKHPHTNMAKAALNMMTRTSAPISSATAST